MPWDLNGNAGTDSASNYLGTSDNSALSVRANGKEGIRVTQTGSVGIGTVNPNAPLEVVGGAIAEGVSLGISVGNTNYPYSYETVGVADLAYNLRLQSPNAIILHAGGTDQLAIGAGGEISIGPQAASRVLPGVGVNIQGSFPSTALLVEILDQNAPAIVGKIVGANTSASVAGENSGGGFGIYGLATPAAGVNCWGVYGAGGSVNLDQYMGDSLGGGVIGLSDEGGGVVGMTTSPTQFHGVEGRIFGSGSGAGTAGYSYRANSPGIYGENLSSGGYAGLFHGDVVVSGTLSAGAKNFKIDHPLDPENKYLNHTSVESPDPITMYGGNVTTDEMGIGEVELPKYFEVLNKNIRYQLTAIGKMAQAVVLTEVQNGSFTIKTSEGKVKVSWQVSGERHDRFSEAHRRPVEEDKSPHDRGRYLHPDLYQGSQADLKASSIAARGGSGRSTVLK
jgi:hypothetical protein